MRSELAELWESRFLLRMLVTRELKIRYKNSAFGFLWSVVPVLADVIIYSFVARYVIRWAAPNYSAYLLCGLIPWLFIQNAVLDSSQSILIYYPIIRKVYLPREVVPLSVVLSNFVHFLLAWSVYFCAFLIVLKFVGGGIPVLKSLAWFPVITLMALLFAVGLSLWTAALNVFFEDVKFIVQTVFRLLMFLLPIIFPIENIRDTMFMHRHPWLFKLYLVNPLTMIIQAYRKTILQPMSPKDYNFQAPTMPMDWSLFAISFLISIAIAWSGYAYFNARKWRFVERN